MKRRFSQVDVFTDVPLKGNPLAVVHDAGGLTDDAMQALARWTNLSETAFLLPPTDAAADYRVRIFTPGGELPFAGHPTLGSCHAWLEAGGVPRSRDGIVQQCGVGPVRIRRDGGRIAFAAPSMRASPVDDALLAEVLAALGLAPAAVRAAQWLDNGPRWLGLQLDRAATVLGVEPDHAALKLLAKVGLVGPHATRERDIDGREGVDVAEGLDRVDVVAGAAGCEFEVRAFAAPIGIPEDPVTGSLNASLAQWMIGRGAAPSRYVAAQGTRLGRAGRVHIDTVDDTVWVGGASVTCIRGEIDVD